MVAVMSATALTLALLLGAPVALPPVLSPPAGTYGAVQSVTVRAQSSGSIIRCTTDGSTPTLSSARYLTPLSVSATTTVRCKAWVQNKQASVVASALYTINLVAYPGELVAIHVGPGQTHANLRTVPWSTLAPGTTVYLHYQATPYYDKILISTRGTQANPIRLIGVVGPNGELPVISGNGAVTSPNADYYWTDPSIIQYSGVVQIAINAAGGGSPVPGWIEIAYIKIQDSWSGTQGYQFTAENGTVTRYEAFSACLYARSPQNLLVHDCEFTNCGQGFYNWTGAGTTPLYWDAMAQNMTFRDNYFHGNSTNGWTEHQIYTEGDLTIIEGNRFGLQRTGALGSQIKDRSAGTVIRYNWIEQSRNGWNIDLVEPENGFGDADGPGLGFSNPKYRTAFVYGNVLQSTGQSSDPNFVHWNEDHQTDGNPNAQPGGAGPGRAVWPGTPPGKLYFYHNTVVQNVNAAWHIFNLTFGAYECPPGLPAGIIDVRNNLIVTRPGVVGPPVMAWAFCGQENFDFGVNWVSPGYNSNGRLVTGLTNLVSPANNNPGLTNVAGFDYTLTATSSALGLGAALPADVTSNALGLDLTPTLQINPVTKQGRIPRAQSGAGSDLGAFER